MKKYVLNHTPMVTFIICALTCLAYEAIRINGWLNRFAPDWHGDTSKLLQAVSYNFNGFAIVAYLTILVPCFVVIANKHNPRLKLGWCLIAFIALILACNAIPDAMVGRWSSTNDEFLLVYWFIGLVPALISILWGIFADREARKEAS